jgi:hypothetical protein
MFPTLRLLIGALFASVIALCGGFGVFAAFRVNHEPLGRLPADTGALQLVADAPVRPALTWGVPFRPQAKDGQIRVSDLNAPSPAPVRRTAIRLGNPATLRIDAVSKSRPAPTSQAVVPSAAAAAASKLSYMPPPAAPAPVTARTPGTSAVATGAAQTLPPATSAAKPPQHAAVAEAKVVQTALAVRPATVEASAQTPKTVIASTAATGPAAKVATPAILAAIPAVETQHKGKPKPPQRIVRKPAERHRVVAKRRVIGKTAAQPGEQNSALHEPVFRSAPSFTQQPQTPTRAAKKSGKDDAPVNPFAWSDAH